MSTRKAAILAAMRERAARRYSEMQGAARPASSGPAADVERWPPLPGQTVGDAKDEETWIRESGFDPVRFEQDARYRDLPGIADLASRYARVATERERRERTEEIVRQSKHVAEHGPEMQRDLQRAEIEREIARLRAALDAMPAPADEDEDPEDGALAADEASGAEEPEE